MNTALFFFEIDLDENAPAERISLRRLWMLDNKDNLNTQDRVILLEELIELFF